jgi:hypothetical protein
MCAFCEQDPRVIGEFFGYHKCCIDAFIEHAKKYGGGDTANLTHYQEKFLKMTNGASAFMPCNRHAKKVVRKQLGPKDMVSNRICSAPFPNIDDNSLKEFDEWLAQSNK